MTPFGIGRRQRRRPRPADSGKPILAVDVDGVLSLFGFEETPESPDLKFQLVDGQLYCFSLAAGRYVQELSREFQIVWATGWEHRVEQLSELLGLPEWPYLTFKGAARFGSADWKLAPLEEYAHGRPMAWIDDSLDEACYEWARMRPEPTLLVDVESHSGLQQVHVEALGGWARSLEASSPGSQRS